MSHSAQNIALHSEPETEDHVHHGNYVKVWAILVVLLIISVLGPLTRIRWLVLFAAFGIAVIKAYMVAKNFMHVNVERRWVELSVDHLPGLSRYSICGSSARHHAAPGTALGQLCGQTSNPSGIAWRREA